MGQVFVPDNALSMTKIYLSQRNFVDRFAPLGVDQIGVNFGGRYVFICQHIRYPRHTQTVHISM